MMARTTTMVRFLLAALILLLLFTGINAQAQSTRATVAAQPDSGARAAAGRRRPAATAVQCRHADQSIGTGQHDGGRGVHRHHQHEKYGQHHLDQRHCIQPRFAQSVR